MTEDIDKARSEFEPNGVAYSAVLGFNKYGIVEISQHRSFCYSSVFYSIELQLSRLFIYFGSQIIKNSNHGDKWADWVINRSHYSDAFITKDVAVGFDIGFEVNTKTERGLMQSGMLALRHPFEFKEWAWRDFIELGYSPEQSYALATNVIVDNGELYTSYYQNNHLVIPKGQRLHLYSGVGEQTPTTITNLYEGSCEKVCMFNMWGCVDEYIPPQVGNYYLNRKNCDKILKEMETNNVR